MKLFCLKNWFLQRGLSFDCLVCGLLFCVPTLILAAPGNLDLTFGAGGVVITNIRMGDQSSAIVTQTDGKIVAVGSSDAGNSNDSDFALVRYNADGSPDGSFGINGVVVTAVSSKDDEAYAAAIQTDGEDSRRREQPRSRTF